MISFNMTAGNDNAIIWVIELELSTGNLYFCSGFNTESVSLDTGSEMRVYANKLQRNSLSLYPQSIPAESAGGIGSRNGFQFVIAAYGGYDQNDFYPATGSPDVLMSNCRLGWIWSGATDTSDITWLYDGQVENFEAKPDGLYFDVTESNFIEITSLPPYTIQKDYDDKVSYFPQAPKDSLGKPIPIVYGEFDKYTLEYGKHRLTPAIIVNPSQMQYLAACHKFDYTYEDINGKAGAFIYATGLDTYLELIPSVATSNNTFNGHNVVILPPTRSSSQYVKGKLICWLKAPAEKTDITDLDALINEEGGTDFTLPDTKQIQFLFTGETMEQLGALSPASADCALQVTYQSSSNGSQRTLEIKYYNPIKSGGAGYTTNVVTDSTSLGGGSYKTKNYEFGNDTSAKSNTTLPWDLKEILQLGFTVKNVSGATGGSVSGDIKIMAVSLVLNNISVYNFKIKYPWKVDKLGNWLGRK